MFGYVTIRKPELKIKDYEIYHSFYCGLCKRLGDQYGYKGKFTLTYDMTFLVILLSSLYEETQTNVEKHRCMVHPAKQHTMRMNAITDYAADMNMLLSYYHFKDDWEDEKSKKAKMAMKLYQKDVKQIIKKYPVQSKGIKSSIEKLTYYEKIEEKDITKLAGCFGTLMESMICYKNDIFTDDIKKLGFHLGCFIYYMDAFDDYKEDKEKGCFNPFEKIGDEKDFYEKIEAILLKEIELAAMAFEKLPCLLYSDIIRNILYAGVWNKFDKSKEEQQ